MTNVGKSKNDLHVVCSLLQVLRDGRLILNGPIPASVPFNFIIFTIQTQFELYKSKNAEMMCMGFEPGAKGW